MFRTKVPIKYYYIELGCPKAVRFAEQYYNQSQALKSQFYFLVILAIESSTSLYLLKLLTFPFLAMDLLWPGAAKWS